MFSKAIVLIFLMLGLSSSVAHAIPHQVRAQDLAQTSCGDTTQPDHSVKSKTDTGDTTAQKGLNHSTTQKGNDVHKSGDTTVKATSLDKGTSKNVKVNSAVAVGGNNNNTGNNNDPQTSLCLDKTVLVTSFENNDGLNKTAGQAASLTSSNNFINTCIGKTPTNGQQIPTGSCNSVPMGDLPSSDKMPAGKFTSPKNLDTVKANTTFTVTMAMINMQAGVFTDPDHKYFAAPQALDQNGQIVGHVHVVIQPLKSLTATDVVNPKVFTFFKGIDTAVQNGAVSVDVPGGIPPGTYKLSSLITAANHQGPSVPIAQHGPIDDAIYFSATQDGNPDTSTGATGTTTTTGKAADKAAAVKGNNNPAGNTTTTTTGKGADKVAVVKGNKDPARNATTTPDQQSGTPSASPSPAPKQGKNNLNKAINVDVTKQQKDKYPSPGNKRRSFHLEFRKDMY